MKKFPKVFLYKYKLLILLVQSFTDFHISKIYTIATPESSAIYTFSHLHLHFILQPNGLFQGQPNGLFQGQSNSLFQGTKRKASHHLVNKCLYLSVLLGTCSYFLAPKYSGFQRSNKVSKCFLQKFLKVSKKFLKVSKSF